jgi:hypothetical protein
MSDQASLASVGLTPWDCLLFANGAAWVAFVWSVREAF